MSVPYEDVTKGYTLKLITSLSHSVIRSCRFFGNGIYANVYDANLFEKCFIAGSGDGIIFDCANGVLNNTIRDSTIVVNKGNSVRVVNGGQIIIENNQIEYNGTATQDLTYPGMIYLQGQDRKCEHIIIDKNNLGGGSNVNYLINIQNATDTIITKNRLYPAGNVDINISASADRTKIANDNYGLRSSISVKDYKFTIANNGTDTVMQ